MSKQSSPELSTLAAKVLREGKTGARKLIEDDPEQVISLLLSFAGGVLSNDETKGQQK